MNASLRQTTRRRPLARHRVRGRLESMILDGQFSPGSRLPQQSLARRLGVTQGAVRESLLELQLCGLVEISDGQGAFVSEITLDTVIETSLIREALESMSAALCCAQANRTELAELKGLAHEVDQAGVTGQIREMAKLDSRFHHRIVELTRKPILLRLTDSYRVITKTIQLHQEGQTIAPEHEALVEPIEENDPQEAERRMRKHIHNGTMVLLGKKERGETYQIPVTRSWS